MAAIGDENVSGLDVAMNDSFAVGGVEGVGDFGAQFERLIERHGLGVDSMFERAPFEKFHRDKLAAVLLADVVYGADVRMIQGGGCLGFSAESFERLRIARYIVWQELQCDETVEAYVFGFVDNAHAPTAEFFGDAVMRDGFSDQRGSVHRWRRMLGFV